MKNIKFTFIATVSAFVIIGFLGGIVGELWVNSFLMPDPYLRFKSYDDLAKKIDDLVQTQEQKKELNERDLAVNATVNNVRGSVVAIFKPKTFAKTGFTSLMPADLLGQGAIVTSDGWIVTSGEVVKDLKTNCLVLADNNKLYEATIAASRDKASGAAFLKIEEKNLGVVQFALKNNLVNGQAAYVFGENKGVSATNIVSLNYSKLETAANFLRSSEEFYKYILLDEEAGKDQLGSPVISLDGKMIGLLYNSDGVVLPVDMFKSALRNLGAPETVAATYLGVNFYDLSEVHNFTFANDKGAYIVKSGIAANSPALSVLLPEDIILKVENEEITASRTLPEIISGYRGGETIKLTVLRSGSQQEVSVKLGTVK